MSKKRILLILHLPPPVHGSSVVGQYIKDSQMINASFDCRYIRLNTSENINDIGKNKLNKFFKIFAILIRLLWQVITFKPNLCYFAITIKGIGFYKDSLAVLILKLFKVKIVYHLHNKGVSTRQHKFIDNQLYRITFKNTSVILLSKYLYPDIKKYVQEKFVYYCPNGIPEKQLVPNDSELRLKGATKVDKNKTVAILFLSNLIESKGVNVLLEACKILNNKGINFQCTFVGGEGDITKQQIEEKIGKLKMNGSIQYLGKKYGIEKDAIFAKTDIFAFPTYYQRECFPLVILEAMQNGLPVISTFEGGIAEIVDERETGFLIPSKNPEVLAERLEILIKNSDMRKKMGIAALYKYANNYTLNTFETKLHEILREIS